MEVDGHVCEKCNKVFPTPCQLRQHNKVCGSEKESEKSNNHQIQETSITNRHSLQNSNRQAWQNQVAHNGYLEKQEYLSSSLYRATYSCKICNKLFINYGSYRRHLRMHGSGRRYVCRVCNKGFFRRYMCIQHEEKAHGQSTAKASLNCFCGAVCKDSDALREHTRLKHQAPFKPRAFNMPVKYDSAKFLTRLAEVKKQTLSHSKNPNFEKIPKSNPAALNSNSKSQESNDNGVKCVCDLCLKLFDNQEQLQQHKFSIHQFQIRSNVNTNNVWHLKSSHSSDKGASSFSTFSIKPRQIVYTCEKCRKTFIHKSSFLRHKRMHTGIRPYTCEYCCFSFFRSEALNNHKQKHVRNPQFRCYVCSHRAKNAELLKLHFKTHSQTQISNAYRKQTWTNLSDANNVSSINEKVNAVTSNKLNIVSRPIFTNIEVSDLKRTSNYLLQESSRNTGTSTSSDAYTCNKCNKQFNDHLKYSQHVLEHRGISSLYICKVCGKQLKNVEAYERHLQIHKRNTYSEERVNLRERSDVQLDIVPNNLDQNKTQTALDQVCDTKFLSSNTYHQQNQEKNGSESEENLKQDFSTNKLCSLLPNNTKNSVYHIENNRMLNGSSLSISQMTYSRTEESSFENKIENDVFLSQKMFRISSRYKHACNYCKMNFLTKNDLELHELKEHAFVHRELTVSKIPNGSDISEASSKSNTSNASPLVYMSQVSQHHMASGYMIASPPETLNFAESAILNPFTQSYTNAPELHFINSAQNNINIPQITAVRSLQSDEGCKNYKCANCNKASDDLKDLLIHINKCKVIENTLENGSGEENLSHRLHGKGTYKQCSRCKKQFSSYSSLLGHLCIDREGKQSQTKMLPCTPVCSLCHAKFETEIELEGHVSVAHHRFEIYSCPMCSKFGSKKQIEKHVITHMTKIGNVVALNESLGDVLLSHAKTKDKCEIKLEANTDKSTKMLENNANDESSIDCKLDTTNNMNLTKIKTELPDDSATERDPLGLEYCIMCDETFPSDLFEIHLMNHRGESTSAFEKNGQQRSNKKELSKVCEDSNEDFGSDETGKDNKEPEDDNAHSYDGIEEITIEPSIEIFSEIAQEEVEHRNSDACRSQDAEGSEIVGSLMEHINGLVNSGDLFQDKSATVRCSNEIWSIKDDIYYKCSECGRRFVNQSSFYRHRRWHQGLMKYSCPYCPRLFYRKDQCDKHIVAHVRQAKQK